MSDLVDAMIIHMHYLVHEEGRPFSYRDFMRFVVDGQEYRMTHGTFRNNISRLRNEGLVEVLYISNIAFYTPKGVKFGKANRITVTDNHTGVPIIPSAPLSFSLTSTNPLYRIIRDLPLNKSSVHDIRLRFISPQIYTFVYSLISNKALRSDYTVNSRSKDILLPAWKIRDLLIKTTIHRTDTVSIVIGCSLNPISLDIHGLIRLTNALSVVEERLSRLLEGSPNGHSFAMLDGSDNPSHGRRRLSGRIPPHSEWIVTMWHFGADASIEYSGEKFSVTWETAESTLIRAYSKMMNDHKTRVRLERQEYPKATLADIIEQRLSREGVS